LPTKYLTLDDSNVHNLVFDSSPVTVDRSVVQEDQTQGQFICAYTIDVHLANATDSNQWMTGAPGRSTENKKIDI